MIRNVKFIKRDFIWFLAKTFFKIKLIILFLKKVHNIIFLTSFFMSFYSKFYLFSFLWKNYRLIISYTNILILKRSCNEMLLIYFYILRIIILLTKIFLLNERIVFLIKYWYWIYFLLELNWFIMNFKNLSSNCFFF